MNSPKEIKDAAKAVKQELVDLAFLDKFPLDLNNLDISIIEKAIKSVLDKQTCDTCGRKATSSKYCRHCDKD